MELGVQKSFFYQYAQKNILYVLYVTIILGVGAVDSQTPTKADSDNLGRPP